MAQYAAGNVALVANTAAPSTPSASSVVVAGLTGATYYFQITAVTATGESVGSTEGSQVCASGHGLQLTIPAVSGAIVAYNVYVNTVTATEILQTAGFTGTTWTMTNVGTNGIVSGGPVTPTVNTSGQQNIALFTAPAAAAYNVTDLLMTTAQSTAFGAAVKIGPLGTTAGVTAVGTTVFNTYLVAGVVVAYKPDVPISVPAGSTLYLQVPGGSSTTVYYNFTAVARATG